MKLCMIGTGYVGLVSGVCFSDLGNDVICVDKDIEKINSYLENNLLNDDDKKKQLDASNSLVGKVKEEIHLEKEFLEKELLNKNIDIANWIGKQISTKYYLTEFSRDVIGVEICSAIKNIYAMVIGSGQNLNAASDLFQKSVNEMRYLIKYFKGDQTTILGLAGIGDLYVSAVGGRNSKMGDFLGKGFTFAAAKKKFMPKDTVEGEQLAREIAPYILRKINKKKIPLMINLLRTILYNKKI